MEEEKMATHHQDDGDDDGWKDWQRYPAGLPSYDPFAWHTTEIRARFDVFARQSLSSKVVVDILDVQTSTANVAAVTTTHHSFFDADEVESHVRLHGGRSDLRIICLFRKHSLAPLLIHADLLLKLLHRHAVSPVCLDLLYSLRTDDDLSEKGQALWSPLRVTDEVREFCYQIRYMERNDHPQGQRWSERQYGVYHRFGGPGQSVMVLANAGMTTKAQTRLQETLADGQQAGRAVRRPLLLHILLLTTYIDNWRVYLAELGQWCLKRENRFLTVPLNHPSLCFEELQELRDLESRLLSASSNLQSTLIVLRELEACGLGLSTARDEVNATSNRLGDHGVPAPDVPEMRTLRTLKHKALAYQRSVEIIQARTQIVAQLVSDGLNQQSQQTANSIADSSHALTLKSLHDSYVVKVVTVITVVYLPMQGVATFFGMNVTDLDARTNRFHFASNWWLFVATAVPLTLFTLGFLALAMRLEGRRKRRKRRQEGEGCGEVGGGGGGGGVAAAGDGGGGQSHMWTGWSGKGRWISNG